MAKMKPRLFTPAGCAAVGDLLARCLKERNLTATSAPRWILDRVELPEGITLSGSTVLAIVNKRYPTFRFDSLEILCASGIFDPLTREEVWNMACEHDPNEKTGSDPNPSLPAQLESIAQSLQGAIAEMSRMQLRLSIPLIPPRDRFAAIALFQGILHQNFAGWPAEKIAQRFSFGGEPLEPWRVQSWLDGRSLPTDAEALSLGLEGVRLMANGEPLSDQWLDTFTEEWWERNQPPQPSAPSKPPLVDQLG